MNNNNYNHIFVLISILLIVSCSKNIGWKEAGLLGRVETVFDREYEPISEFGEWNGGAITKNGSHHYRKFNKDGNLIELGYVDRDSKLITKTVIHYKDKKEFERLEYNANGKMISKILVTHLKHTEKIFKIIDKEGKTKSFIKTYFEKDLPVKSVITTINGGKISEEVIVDFEYNDIGQESSIKVTNYKGIIRSHNNYEYFNFDDKGNWTKKLVYENWKKDKPSRVFLREYEYY